MAEWFNAPVLKTGVGASLPRVQIPALPPYLIEQQIVKKHQETDAFLFFSPSKMQHPFIFIVLVGESKAVIKLGFMIASLYDHSKLSF